MPAARTRPRGARRSAEERRGETVAIALEHFGLDGYRGTSTEAIAREAGISQPYLFRLFGTKRDLFLACCDRCHAAVQETFTAAAEAVPREQRLDAIGRAYVDLLADRRLLLFQLQMYAACSDPVIQERVRDGYRETVGLVTRLSGAGGDEVRDFFAHGMLLNVIASLDLQASADRDDWARTWSARRPAPGAPGTGSRSA